MTPDEFVQKWANNQLTELQGYQDHFRDVCELVGHTKPGSSEYTETGEYFHFQRHTLKIRGQGGFADVYFENHFAIEYKRPGKYKDLDRAFEQLQQYQRQLKNPPLLIVTDINNWRIHTNFTNTIPAVYEFSNGDIGAKPEILRWLRDIFFNPQVFNPARNTHVVTRETANALKAVADDMRLTYGVEPEQAARFLTRIIFCLFAEDVGLLPSVTEGKGLFSYIVEQNRNKSQDFRADIEELFKQMEDGGRLHSLDIKWFNGALFKNVETESLSIRAIVSLENACKHDWRYVEPAIFGTLFERCLDPAKRAQLGAHYTSPEDILLIVEPVLMQPLRREWAATQAKARAVRERFSHAGSVREEEAIKAELLAIRDEMLDRLRCVTVLDPACGSGNFLYIALQQMMDLELDIINDPLWDGFDRAELRVSPAQLYGIEKDEIAHALASIVVWIGYIKWREDHGFRYDEKPLLRDLSKNIVCKDAILAADDEVNTMTPDWPAVDVIVGNPPFLGSKRQREELGDDYVERLREYYDGRLPAFVDLACYWFENARHQIEHRRASRAGLLATNSIRDGSSREALTRIKATGDIFMAWSDNQWILDGAAVRISIVGFDAGLQKEKTLDGRPVEEIHSNLTSAIDLTRALTLDENQGISFIGVQKGGDFDISELEAKKMIESNNARGFDNADVVAPLINGRDILRRPRNRWIINFQPPMSLASARNYALPFAHIETHVFPSRQKLKMKRRRDYWWIHAAPALSMRKSLMRLNRYICTSLTAKHRVFVWLDAGVICDSTTVAIARDDDYFFGVLHSKLHEVWSLRMGTSLEDRPRYTPTTTFETFPFPWSPGHEDESHPAHAAISAAARQLHVERQAWQNPHNPHPPAPSPKMREGEQTRVKWDIPPELERQMQVIARELRKNPTVAEDKLWQAIRKRRLDGRKFRRQVAIGAFVVDFYCSSERLAVEVDGPIHENQREADRIRQELIESLGIRFVRLSNEEVEHQLESSLNKIRQSFADDPAKDDEKPLPLDGGGVWGGGESDLKDRTLTNLYNALQVWRGESDIKTKPAAADFAPRLDELHRALDRAVCDAYGWELAVLDDEEEMLRRLLALNLERAE